MGRLFSMIAILLGVWAAAEVYTKGFDSAFGGVLAGLDDPVVPLSEVHSGGGRGVGPPGRREAQSDAEDWTDDDDILVIEDEDPFAPKPTPVTRLGARVQGEINGAYESRYGNR
jgi:hypothetical protein